MNWNSVARVSKDLTPKALNVIVKNKDKVIIAVPYGICAYLLGRDIYKTRKQNEKDFLYQKLDKKRDAQIRDLKVEASKVKRLQEINGMLMDAVVELKEANA